MSDHHSKTTKVKHPKHWFFTDEASNFFYAHLLGSIFPFLCTCIITIAVSYLFSDIPFFMYMLIFGLFEFFIYSTIENTKVVIPPYHYDPITINGTFKGQFAPSGTYRRIWPFDLFSEERLSVEPSAFEIPSITATSAPPENLQLVGGKTLVSFTIDLQHGKKFTKNTKENFIKVLGGKIKQELITLVNNSNFTNSKDVDTTDKKQDNIRQDLEEIAVQLTHADEKNYPDVYHLCRNSGVLINSITIENFIPQDEEDKDALALRNRKKQENAALLEKEANFTQMVKNYRTTHPDVSEKDAREAIQAITGYVPTTRQIIQTDGTGGGTGSGITPVVVVQSKN